MSLGLSVFTNNQGVPTVIAAQADIPNAAGAGNGDSVTVSVGFTDQYGTGRLPARYSVQVTASQDCFTSVNDKSATGFTVTLTPTSSGVTLAAGEFDVVVVG